jgi:hypothetical protein
VPPLGDPTFPVFGLDETWTGHRCIGGRGGNPDQAGHWVTNTIVLAHGGDAEAGSVRVETIWTGPDNQGTPRGLVAKQLVRSLWHRGLDHETAQPMIQSADPSETWAEIQLSAQGTPVTFRILTVADAWVAVGHIEGQLVGIDTVGVAVDNVRLVRIENLELYSADTRPA